MRDGVKRILVLLLSFGFGVACVGEIPTSDGVAADIVATADSGNGCTAVRFHVAVVRLSATTWAGPVTGDLEGQATVEFVGGIDFQGVTATVDGVHHWDITGGVLGPLTFDTEFSTRSIFTDRPGSPADVFENTGTHRAIGGVQKANLTFHGSFTRETLTTDHNYRGVICR